MVLVALITASSHSGVCGGGGGDWDCSLGRERGGLGFQLRTDTGDSIHMSSHRTGGCRSEDQGLQCYWRSEHHDK